MENKANKPIEDTSIVEDFAEEAGGAFPVKLFQTILQFLSNPLKFFDKVYARKFESFLKPIPFFITAFAIATAAMTASTYIKKVTWDELFEKLNDKDNEELAVLLFSTDEDNIDFNAKTNFSLYHDMENALRRKLNIYNGEIGAQEIANYVRAYGNETLALKIEKVLLTSNEDKFAWLEMNILLLFYFIPFWRIFHFFLKPKNRTPKETITLFLYSTGFLFLFVFVPISYSGGEKITWQGLLGIAGLFYLFFQFLKIIRYTHNVTFGQYIRAIFLTNLCFLPLIIILIIIGGLAG